MVETKQVQGLEKRREDYGLITGSSGFVDDLNPFSDRSQILHMVVVRSPYAHAKINAINLEEARKMSGVVAALSGEELAGNMKNMEAFPLPGIKKPQRRPMAINKVRYVGDPVAVVLAENRYTAIDARDTVLVDYTPLKPVADPELALMPNAPLLYEEFESNQSFTFQSGGGDIEAAFAAADRIIKLRVVNQRIAPSSIEPRACMFDFDPETGKLTAWLSSQAVFRARDTLSNFLGIDRSNILVQNAQVGGGFGAKTTFVGEEILAAALAVKFARPVKWIEGRSENLQGQTQARGQINYIEAAVSNQGRLIGLKVNTIADLGAFLSGATAMVPAGTPRMLNGPYLIQAISSRVVGVYTNKVPTSAYRGAGRPEAALVLERTMDKIADELGLDPAVVRLRNFIPPDSFPYDSLTGIQYDSGDYAAALNKVLELGKYSEWRKKQSENSSNASKLIGIGFGSYLEISGGGGGSGPGVMHEAATVRIRRDGTIQVLSGVATNGQGHYTAFAQIAATTFNVPGSKVEVQMNSTALPAYGIGTFGSRTTPVAASTVLMAAEAVRGKALEVAARFLEASTADLVLEDGNVMVKGVPSRSISLGELAKRVEDQPDLIQHEKSNPSNNQPIEGLAAWVDYNPSNATFPSGTHMAVTEVDTETGNVEILSYVAVDDCGLILNNYLAEAQVHGSLAQGIGQAMYEEVVYDENGQLISGTLMDYTVPTADQIPSFIIDTVETPSPINPLGAKGVGESGCTGAPPAIVNSVLDALKPFGIKNIDMPLRPEKIWTLIQSAKTGTLKEETPQLPEIFKDKKQGKAEGGSGTYVFE